MHVGPLSGIRIIEVAGIGPGPFAAMMLADMGADVIRVDRTANAMGGDPANPPADILNRGRRSIAVDLKSPEGVAVLLELVASADGLIEGFRPGVAERLGFGPDACAEVNPKLVFGRMTGWGQDGPYAPTAGHDINYISLAGVLAHLGREGEKPTPPINLVGDFGGGGMLMAFGMVCALLEAQRSGAGQVVDAAMVDGSASLMSIFHGLAASGQWDVTRRAANLLDGGAPFYDVYETADSQWVSIGSIEPQFYAQLLELSGLEASYRDRGEELPHQMNKPEWGAMKDRLAEIFRTRTRDEWCEVMEGSDVCFAPVLTMSEATRHPHNVARGSFVDIAGIVQPAPAPRFSRTTAEVQRPPAHAGQHTDEILGDWLGLDGAGIAARRASGAVAG